MPDIILTRIYHSLEDEFGILAKFGYIEITHGLCWLASVLLENNYRAEIIDAPPLRLNNDELTKKIVKKNPKYVGISACTLDIFEASDLAEKLKSTRPDIVTIIGGAHVTGVPEETMERFPALDIGVIGEGERTIVDLLDTLEEKNGKKLSEVDGIIYRKNGKILLTKPRSFIKDLDTLPLPAWNLLPDIKKYYSAPPWSMHSGRTATIVTSRGCPFECIFCDRKVFGHRVRFNSAEYVLNMIKTMHINYGISHFRISEDNFIIDKKRLRKICELLIKEKLNISWSCTARVDMINTEMLLMMKKAGCWSISFGVETGSQKIHDLEKKKITLEQIENAVQLTRKAGIRTISFNIIGHPLETIDTIKQTIQFNKKIKVDDFKIQFMVPFPGTELYQHAEKYGTLDKDWKKMGLLNKEPIFITYGLTKEELIKWNKKSFCSFYLQPRIIFSYFSQIRSYKELITIIIGGITLIGWKTKELLTIGSK